LIDVGSLRKINLLSCKERPTCAYCNTLVGFTWHQSTEISLCEKCFSEEKYPLEIEKEKLEKKSVSQEFWNKFDHDVAG